MFALPPKIRKIFPLKISTLQLWTTWNGHEKKRCQFHRNGNSSRQIVRWAQRKPIATVISKRIAFQRHRVFFFNWTPSFADQKPIQCHLRNCVNYVRGFEFTCWHLCVALNLVENPEHQTLTQISFVCARVFFLLLLRLLFHFYFCFSSMSSSSFFSALACCCCSSITNKNCDSSKKIDEIYMYFVCLFLLPLFELVGRIA